VTVLACDPSRPYRARVTLAPMAPPLTLTVPESVGAFYAVPTTDGSVRVESLVAAGLGRVEEALPRPLPQPLMQVHRVEDLPPLPLDQLAAAGATDDQLARLRAATHLVLVSVGGRPGWPPTHEWIARTLAVGAATRLGSDVIDLLVHQVLAPTAVQASLPDDEGMVCLADWVAVDVWPEHGGYTCTTAGLRRFGLPELRTLAAPADLVDSWGRVMVGLAGRLLGAWRDALVTATSGPVTLPGAIELSDTDVIEAHVRLTAAGDGFRPQPGAASVVVRLGLDVVTEPHGLATYLTVRPPDPAGDGRAFVTSACEVLFGQSAAAARPTADPELERAIAAARSGLPAIRDRYMAGEFATSAPEPGRPATRPRLLVRYALAVADAYEYLWAYVTSWRDPSVILATTATDSVLHPDARAGRPVVLDAAAVVDWAVEQDGVGIVEGAYTA
jgi:hypothetical protein